MSSAGSRAVDDRHSPLAMLTSGVLVAIATAGALLGLGWRDGEPSRVFRQAGRNLLGVVGLSSTATPLRATMVGYLHHLVVATLWGMLLALVILRLRGVSRVVALVLLVPLYTFLVPRVVPPLLRIGHAVTSDSASLFPIAATIAVALLGGVWVAAGSRSTRDARG
jgi:hypothetical protein